LVTAVTFTVAITICTKQLLTVFSIGLKTTKMAATFVRKTVQYSRLIFMSIQTVIKVIP